MKKSTVIRLAISAALIVSMFAAAGCGDSGAKAAVDQFMSGAMNKDCEKMVDAIDIQSMQTQVSSITRESLLEECKQSQLDEVVSYKIVEEKVEGDKATIKVEVTVKKDGQESTSTDTLTVMNRDGAWKISTV